MRYIVPIGIVALLLLSGFGAAVSHNGQKTQSNIEQVKSCSISISATPTFTQKGTYLEVAFDGTNQQTNTPGLPVLPTLVKNFQIPAHAINIRVLCTFSSSDTIIVSEKILPAAPYVIQDSNAVAQDNAVKENEQLYSSAAWYPSSLYNYRISCGRNEQNRIVNFVDVEIYPVRYSPATNTLQYLAGSGDITITYDIAPQEPKRLATEYDLVIIAPAEFTSALQKLVDHKNSIGVKTMLKSVDDIYTEYQGRDKPEQIKHFIADAYEQWNISSVLLVGGLKSHLFAFDREDANQGSKAWWIPVRYTNIYLYERYSPTAEIYEPGCPSDLYYADIYKAGEIFDDWNSNNNSIFAEAKVDMAGYSNISDTLDLSPDVAVSRLPCSTLAEVQIVVKKIITYEQTNASDKPWFKTMVAIAGKTSRFYGGKPDGEYICDAAITSMGSLVDPVRLYVTNNATGGPRPIPTDIIRQIRKGAGYVDFEGHGNPLRWDTIWADGAYPTNWAGGLRLKDFIKLTNFNKLPIVVIGGCHNGLFNVSLLQTMRDLPMFLNKTRYWTHGMPAPFCFAWGLLLVPYGGAIASIAGTGLGIGPGGGTPLQLSAALESNFFYAIGQGGAQTFGEARSGAINKYLHDFPTIDALDYHCISIYQPFGDPSLRLGGG
jgi:hypothetical protein